MRCTAGGTHSGMSGKYWSGADAFKVDHREGLGGRGEEVRPMLYDDGAFLQRITTRISAGNLVTDPLAEGKLAGVQPLAVGGAKRWRGISDLSETSTRSDVKVWHGYGLGIDWRFHQKPSHFNER
jgi:hypothetical protein